MCKDGEFDVVLPNYLATLLVVTDFLCELPKEVKPEDVKSEANSTTSGSQQICQKLDQPNISWHMVQITSDYSLYISSILTETMQHQLNSLSDTQLSHPIHINTQATGNVYT